MSALAIGLDLGSTRIKTALLHADGELTDMRTRPTPALTGSGLRREGDADEWLAAIENVLAPHKGSDLPLGLASQRSTFLLWRRSDGRPRTPLISWQDRRAAQWCERAGAQTERIHALTGLFPSAHYAGPKLATLLAGDPSLRSEMEAGDTLFGTLDTWLKWHWSAGDVHECELGMAARTLMVDLRAADWSDELLELYGVPRRALGEIVASTSTAARAQHGPRCTATLADQASGLLATLGPDAHAALWNLGTGCFVLRPTGASARSEPRFLAGPLFAPSAPVRASARYALEGTINAGGKTLARFAGEPGNEANDWPERDPAPDGFCSPDENGLGAPHWDPTATLSFSAAAPSAPGEQRRLVLEGLIFRAHEILDALFDEPAAPPRLLVSGGLAAEDALPAGMAALLGTPVEVLGESETTLLGAARLAAGASLPAPIATRTVAPEAGPAWLRPKAAAWGEWMHAGRP